MIRTEIASRRIPDGVTVSSSLVLVLLYILFRPEALWAGIAGGVLGFGTLCLISRFRTMGRGDIKYAFPAGLLTGWLFVFPGLLLASIAALCVFVPLVYRGKIPKDYPVPFGPFILAGSIGAYSVSIFLTGQ